jgi:hypothetical protein
MLHSYKDTTLSVEEQVPASQPPGNYYENPEGPRFQNPAEFNQAAAPEPQPAQQPGVVFNRPDFQAMREQALQDAIAQVTQRQATGEPQQQFIQPPVPQPAPASIPVPQAFAQPVAEPQIVYVKRNLTLAEIIIVFAITTGCVLGIQGIWTVATDILPRIEIKDK